MPKTHFPTTAGSGNEWALPLSQYMFGAPVGNVIFVNSVTGSDTAGYGYSPESPVATWDYAIGRCTASQGDTILLCPGHTETLTAAAAIAMDVAGIRVIGLGVGRNRPTVNYTTSAAASLDITAANCSIENVVFNPQGVDAVTAAVNITGPNVRIANCEFDLAGATNQAVLGILTAATATRMLIEDCFFHGTGDAGTAAAIRHASGNDCIIRNNIFHGAYTTTLGAIDNSAAVLNLQIHNNKINNMTASSAKGIVCHASSTGQISGNHIQILTGTAPIAGAAMSWVGNNYYAATIATAGTLI